LTLNLTDDNGKQKCYLYVGKFRGEVPQLLELIESRQFMAHANSILEGESAEANEERKKKKAKDLSKVHLLDRLDEYYEDPELVKGIKRFE